MHNVIAKGLLSSNNGMNIYRGCSHGCIYCDSRSKCYNMKYDFEDIEVKENAPQLLEKALLSKRNKCMISTGSMTDPYIHIEEKIGNMRKCLEIILKYGYGVVIHTKSNRILRDLDILKKINENSKCIIQMTLTTYDEELCKIIEPNVCTTKERFNTLKILRDNKIKTIVWLCPILPFINDTKENLLGILNYCIDAKVYGIVCFGFGLTLREGSREYFYKNLDEKFAGLKDKYIKAYGNAYELTSPNSANLMKLFVDKCKKNKIEYDINKIFNYLHNYEDKNKQLSLFK